VPQLDSEYVKTGKLRLAVRDFPLESIHPQALKAAEATHCAAEQDKYWEMHDRLFAHQQNLSPGELPGHAKEVGLDVARFQECLTSGKYEGKVRAGLSDGLKAGVRGTPTFYLGLADPDGKLKVLKVLRGALAVGVFKSAIDSALAAPQ
jgi:protein-disulfide isomerase